MAFECHTKGRRERVSNFAEMRIRRRVRYGLSRVNRKNRLRRSEGQTVRKGEGERFVRMDGKK